MQKVDILWQTIYLSICDVYTGNPIQRRWFKRRPDGQKNVKVCSEMQRLISPVLAELKDPEYKS